MLSINFMNELVDKNILSKFIHKLLNHEVKGKGLSTEDFTTELKDKINNIDLSNEELEKIKSDVYTKTEIDNKNFVNKTEVDNRIQNIIGAAPADLDTLEEIAEKLQDGDDIHTALIQSISDKAPKSDVDALKTLTANYCFNGIINNSSIDNAKNNGYYIIRDTGITGGNTNIYELLLVYHVNDSDIKQTWYRINVINCELLIQYRTYNSSTNSWNNWIINKINGSNIVDSTITNSKIADNTITNAKLAEKNKLLSRLAYSHTNGFLFTTAINKSNVAMTVVEVSGLSYSNITIPIKSKIEFYSYRYLNTTTNAETYTFYYPRILNMGVDLGDVYVFYNSDDKVCIWFPQITSYQTLDIFVKVSNNTFGTYTYGENLVEKIENKPLPTEADGATLITKLQKFNVWDTATSTKDGMMSKEDKAKLDSGVADKLISKNLTNEDLNTFITPKYIEYYYSGGGNTCKNKPNGVDAFSVENIRSADGGITQILTANNGICAGNMYIRRYLNIDNQLWTSWKKILTEDDNAAGIITKQLTNEDLNDIKDDNFSFACYYATATNTCTNKPDGVNNFTLQVYNMGKTTFVQMLVDLNGNIYRRIQNSNIWSPWKRMLTEDDLQKTWTGTESAYNAITTKDANTIYYITE